MKLKQAARQALVALEDVMADFDGSWALADTAITALREALNHSADADKMIGCAYCNNPLFAGTKCNNCGRVTLAEQATVSGGVCGGCAKKAADGWALYCVECWEKAEQEPVAWAYIDADGSFMDALGKQHGAYQTPLYAAPVRTKDLTDDEIRAIRFNWERNEFAIDFARAVIAADREKNRGTA